MDEKQLERIDLALRASNEGLWQWCVKDGEILYSARSLSFLGAKGDGYDNIFLDPERHFHFEDLRRVRAAIQLVLEDPYNHPLMAVEGRVKRMDGGVTWLRIRASAILGGDGNLEFLAGSMIDISRRKETEIKLDDERFLLHQLIENIPHNLYFKDLESRFVMANQATAEKMGLSRVQQILGKSDHDFFNKKHADFSRDEELAVMRNDRVSKPKLIRELWNGDADTWGVSYKIPWFDSDGKVLGTFGVTSDVTEMVQVQQRLTQATAKLQDMNTRYYDELELAKQVQQAALDASPASFPRGDFATEWRAQFTPFYKPDSEMAGDFYEVFPISSSKAGVLICDVMGHGVKAALTVALIRGMIEKGEAMASAPEKFLSILNERLVDIFGHAGIQMFATACYMVLDLEKGDMQMSSAGHPMPLVSNAGKVSVLEPDSPMRGPALGMIEDAPYRSCVVALEELEQILLYTDGIYEVENAAGEELGVEGLVNALAGSPCRAGGLTIDKVLTVASAHGGTDEFGDDVCLVAVDIARASLGTRPASR
ncbi:SpoIIE family protein phosphatase [Rubritalea marina]|uniref:SpoIIE family protein phosphatase n=1 Tax=Rubritalea marina TaxID=361055 RepID=UPI00036ACD8C|nr:SpoIIE family protein phosphatase [Rubritalea marina]